MSRRRNDSDDSSDDDEGKCLKSGYSICTGLDALACSAFFLPVTATTRIRLLVKCGTEECGMRNKCGMKTVERCCGTVGKMRNAEICRMWEIVCPREGTVNSYEWAYVVR